MKKQKLQTTVTFIPLTKQQQEYGLKGAIEALDLILHSNLKRKTVEDLKVKLEKQLEGSKTSG